MYLDLSDRNTVINAMVNRLTADQRALMEKSEVEVQPAWFDNHELFIRSLVKGYYFQWKVAEALRAAGLKVEHDELKIRPNPTVSMYGKTDAAGLQERLKFWQSRDEYLKEPDLRVTPGGVLEIKSRDIEFSDVPGEYPFATVIVDTVQGWDAKKPNTPLMQVTVSQQTGAVIATFGTKLVDGQRVPVSEIPDEWYRKEFYDNKRRIMDMNYICAREKFRPMEMFVEYLRKLQSKG